MEKGEEGKKVEKDRKINIWERERQTEGQRGRDRETEQEIH